MVLAAGAAHAAAALPGAAGQPRPGDRRRAAELTGLRRESARRQQRARAAHLRAPQRAGEVRPEPFALTTTHSQIHSHSLKWS